MRLFFPTLLALTSGCALQTTWVDDGLGTDVGELFEDHIASPYVLGQELTLTVHLAGPEGLRGEAHVESNNPSVLLLSDPIDLRDEDTITIPARALASGTASLNVFDRDGVNVHSIPIEVAVPDALEVLPRIATVTETAAPFGSDDTIDLLAGVPNPIAVYYREGDRRLAGTGLLGVHDGGGMDVKVTSEQSGNDHEWIEVTATTFGRSTLSLEVDGLTPFEIVVNVVDASAATTITMTDLTADTAERGDSGMVSAVALGADGGVINGLDPDWSVDGAALPGTGGLLTFTSNPLHCHLVSTSLPDGSTVSASLSVCGDGLQITSDDQVMECATSPAVAGWGALFLAAAVTFRRRPR